MIHTDNADPFGMAPVDVSIVPQIRIPARIIVIVVVVVTLAIVIATSLASQHSPSLD
jgi:hypothetical protein